MQVLPNGLKLIPGCLNREQQEQLVEAVREVTAKAPLFVPRMPGNGKPMTVRMTNCGSLGWVTDKDRGYRYQATHPQTGKSWPEMPEQLIGLWREYTDYHLDPEACLVNYYEPKARMGLHQDRDEEALDAPVLSVSLGDSCLFRYGGKNRKDPTKSIKLNSGDVVLLSGDSRMVFHGVDRIYPGTSTLLKSEGRINLTLRRVKAPA